ncbi:hypothetical protein HF1_08040 [Mycoplasma haemofelis str. Langford 1]|uniref:Uncharacterized protein n=1 Tax=Mycoplasma haemofelis (strain Langford 1) TaxID=941640 RepID=E8ZI41_MYCHL|nr:hypothetical protein [Mycoplasma haemofelis]CBY92812.1 hypothetical protein HF1_08040 [Mycoplasma haemofelis str. Langford 1]
MNKAALFSTAGFGVASAGGYGIYSLSQRETLAPFLERINTKERVILEVSTNTHDSVWQAIVEEYKRNGNIESVPKTGEVLTSLKEYCKNSKSSTSSNPKEFEKYKNYCTRENLITKLSQLNKTWNISEEKGNWAAAESTYKALKGNETGLLMPKAPNTTIAAASVKVEEIIDHCKEISSKPFINRDDSDYKRGEKLCLVNG